MNFTELNLNKSLIDKLNENNYIKATPIQEAVIPLTFDNKDIIACAKTGSGKTLAFLLPVFHNLLKEEKKSAAISVIVLAPTRELALQIFEEARFLAKGSHILAAVLYGGTGYNEQKNTLKKNPDIIIGTPGRILDFIGSKDINTKTIETVIIDEADRMLDMGFIDDVKKIIKGTSQNRIISLFSATYNMAAFYSLWEYMRDPEEILINPELIDHAKIKQELYHLGLNEKPGYLVSLLKFHDFSRVIIFSNLKRLVPAISNLLNKYEISSAGLSSDFNQNKRLEILEKFKKGKFRVLVATDVASRGLHIEDIDLVVNYDIPQDPEGYVHRIGRTARAGKEGIAVSFCSELDYDNLSRIENYLSYKIPNLPPEDDFLVSVSGFYVSDESGVGRKRQRPQRANAKRADTYQKKPPFKTAYEPKKKRPEKKPYKKPQEDRDYKKHLKVKDSEVKDYVRILGKEKTKKGFFRSIFAVFFKSKKKVVMPSQKTLDLLRAEAESEKKSKKYRHRRKK